MSELIAGQVSLLIVDDDGPLRELLYELLSPLYFTVAAASGEEALTLLARQHFDVILADTVLPGMSGLDLVTMLSLLHSDVGVIVMSSAPLDSQHPWIGLGVYAYLTKPFSLDELERLVDTAAHGQSNVELLGMEVCYPGAARDVREHPNS